MLIRARAVLPVTRAIIPDGAVFVSNGRILAVGRWRDLKALKPRAVDLGDCILLPGLINAHCHLDYTMMAGTMPPPRRFTDWLKQIVTSKAEWDLEDYRKSWTLGAEMLLRTGTTTVADIEAFPALLPGQWNSTPLRVLSFLEMIGITNRRTPEEILGEALRKAESLKHPLCSAHLSPHSPYSTRPALLRLVAEASGRKGLLVSTHVAESYLEYQMFARSRGEMHRWIRRSGRDMSDCGKGSPVKHYASCGLLSGHVIAAHVNYLGLQDPARLADSGTHVVHCPRSHEYFRHHRFPLGRLSRAGVNVCLGTDSLASVCKARHQDVELNMFDEMRVLARNHRSLTAKQILRMATVNGACALGLAKKAGELTPGAFADIIAVPFSGPMRQVYPAVLQHRGPVKASLIQGSWAVSPN